MANNHMGDVAHGVATVEAIRKACGGFEAEFDFAFKLQYRDLDTFIHKSYQGRNDIKYIKRFEETRLSDQQFRQLVDAMKQNGFMTVCTPFDENSVSRIEEHGIDKIKIASCSFTDWPLLERIALSEKPIIASTAAATLGEMDNVVSFFLHRGKDFTLMHCVAEYPTPDERLQVNQIGLLKARYPECRIGYSTHESPSNTVAVMLAIAKGAEVFEKHVVFPTAQYSANAYSATPEQIVLWLEAARQGLAICGSNERYEPTVIERDSLLSLKRGVFARSDIAAGSALSVAVVDFAFPPVQGQITASDWSKYARFTAKRDLVAGEPLMFKDVQEVQLRDYVGATVSKVKELLKAGNIVVPGKADLEISHHYGMEKFGEYGLTLINVVNREYCKKLLVMLPGQTHPEQYHLKKEETFVILHGTLTLWLDGIKQEASVGDVITVPREKRHKFFSSTGCVFEEISSTHYRDDSYYTDNAIGMNPSRKTMLTYWI
jgi:N-acetylneuraminate synthase